LEVVSGNDVNVRNDLTVQGDVAASTVHADGQDVGAALNDLQSSKAPVVNPTLMGSVSLPETTEYAGEQLSDRFAAKVDYATPANAQAGTSYTFVAADANRITTASNGSAVTFTIPPQSSVTWGAATILRVVNYGAGALTIEGGSGVTVTNTASTISQYQAASAIRTGEDAWTLVPFGESAFSATGGNEVVTVGSYRYHLFTSSSTFVVASGSGNCEILVVGAGAGGGRRLAGGGGGGAIEPATGYTTQELSGGSYAVTVGTGGSGSTDTSVKGSNGGSSSFVGTSTITALGGGGGASRSASGGLTGGSGGGGEGFAGGSGGSASGNNTNVGGAGENSGNYCGGGGGGATTAGASGSASGNGGSGKTLTDIDSDLTSANFSTFTGMTVISSGGGGGSFGGTAGTGATGAGSGTNDATAAGNGTSFGSGGGGGGEGGGATSGNGGNGFGGLVIVRYAV